MQKRTIIILIVIVVFVVLLLLLISPKVDNYCEGFGDSSMRAGGCSQNAPFFCHTKHRPPGCDGCQDSTSCGF